MPDPAAALGALAVLGAVGVGGMMAWPYLVALAMLPLQILGVVLGSAALWQVYRLYRAWWMVSTARKLVGGRDD